MHHLDVQGFPWTSKFLQLNIQSLPALSLFSSPLIIVSVDIDVASYRLYVSLSCTCY